MGFHECQVYNVTRGNGGADVRACRVISWSWRGGARSTETAERERKGGESPRQQTQKQMALLEDERERSREEVLGGWRVEGGERESELFIAVNGYAVHKDCSEGYPKEKGQRRQVSLI